jgi:hypothetical protein
MILSRLMRSPAMKGAMWGGAAIGAIGGGLYGTASDNTSVIGGAFKGALAGAALGGGHKAWRMMGSPARRTAARAAASAKIGPILASNRSVSPGMPRQQLFSSARNDELERLHSVMNAQVARNMPTINGVKRAPWAGIGATRMPTYLGSPFTPVGTRGASGATGWLPGRPGGVTMGIGGHLGPARVR